ncbi:hypothetical protein CSUB01_04597 [Colletotrichum sublineola]|uniref:Ubiquitin-like protease family profile domain-containing protein n=1 Tax=Colletotrichum sublineola TaxID=1173701 RepID=A0A066X0A0_COLSU|nr:hypothetical protein CSUB01_04597 [Colletotrichum sublineola]
MSLASLQDALDIVNALNFDLDNFWATLLNQWKHLQETFDSISPPPCQPFQLWAYDKVDPKVLTTVLTELFHHHIVKEKKLGYRLTAAARRFNSEPVTVCFFLGIDVALNHQCLIALNALRSNKPEVTLTDIVTRVYHLQTDMADSPDSANGTKPKTTASLNLRGRPLQLERKHFREALEFYDPTVWPKRRPKGGPRPQKPTSTIVPSSSPVSPIDCSDEMETEGGKPTREASEPTPPYTVQIDLCPKAQTNQRTRLSSILESSGEEGLSEMSALEQGRRHKGNDHSLALEDTSDHFCGFNVDRDSNDDDFDDDDGFEQNLPSVTHTVFHNDQDGDSLAQDTQAGADDSLPSPLSMQPYQADDDSFALKLNLANNVTVRKRPSGIPSSSSNAPIKRRRLSLGDAPISAPTHGPRYENDDSFKFTFAANKHIALPLAATVCRRQPSPAVSVPVCQSGKTGRLAVSPQPSIDAGTQLTSSMAKNRRPNLEWLISHLDRFDLGKWFNDDMINTLLRRLCSDSVALVETGAPTSAWRTWTKTPQWMEQASRKAAMLIPLNQGGNHWVLYYYVSSILHVYDPLGHDVSRDNMTTQQVAPFVSRVYGLTVAPAAICLKGPIQPNASDCGVYLIAAASILAEGGALPDRFDGDVLRQRYRNMYLTSAFSTPAESIWKCNAASGGTAAATAFIKFKSSVLFNAATSSYADGDLRSARIRGFLADETSHFGAAASLSVSKALHRQHEAHLRAALEKTAALTIITEKKAQASWLKAIHDCTKGLAAGMRDFNRQWVPPGLNSNAFVSAAKATLASSQTLMDLMEAENHPDATLETLRTEAQGIQAEIAYSYRLCVVYVILARKSATSGSKMIK